MWRTSGDPAVVGWEVEMAQTARVLNLSRPDCWAYPGYAAYSAAMGGSFNESRTQFGVHCVSSSPLVLSFDLLDPRKGLNGTHSIWPILTNDAAIKVNQQWAGSAGALLRKCQSKRNRNETKST